LFENIALSSAKGFIVDAYFIDDYWVGWFYNIRNRFGTSRRVNFAE